MPFGRRLRASDARVCLALAVGGRTSAPPDGRLKQACRGDVDLHAVSPAGGGERAADGARRDGARPISENGAGQSAALLEHACDLPRPVLLRRAHADHRRTSPGREKERATGAERRTSSKTSLPGIPWLARHRPRAVGTRLHLEDGRRRTRGPDIPPPALPPGLRRPDRPWHRGQVRGGTRRARARRRRKPGCGLSGRWRGAILADPAPQAGS
jgi:hypothetical protein